MLARLTRLCFAATLVVTVAGLGMAHAEDVEENKSGIGPFTKANYPGDLIDRPLTLVGGMAEVSLGFSYTKFIDDIIGMSVGASYGVGNKIQVDVGTGVRIDPDADWGEIIGLGVHYLAVDQKALDVAAGLTTNLNFADGADVFSGISLDGVTRFKINNMFALTGGRALIDIGIEPETSASVNLNVGVLAQVVPKVAITLDTQLVHLKITGDNNATTHLGDAIPLTLGVSYTAMPQLDVRLMLNFPSLEDAGDFYTIGLAAAYRI